MREMILLRADGTEIGRRAVPAMKRFSMQAASDHRHADRARAEFGAALHCVRIAGVALHFDARGRSFLGEGGR